MSLQSEENPMMELLMKQGEEVAQEPEEEPLSLKGRQSSYANLRMNLGMESPTKPHFPKHTRSQSSSSIQVPFDNPILVLTKEDNDSDPDEDKPISLSVRQPSFSSLHGTVIPKGGGLLSNEPQIEPVKEDDEQPLGLNVRQSSYASLRLTADQPQKSPEIATIPSDPSIPDNSNPIIVLGDGADDEDAPITLSVRQPSFSSLHGVIIPKGFTPTDLGEIPDEESTATKPKTSTHISNTTNSNVTNSNVINSKDDQEDGPMDLSVRQSSYANLKIVNQSPAKLVPVVAPKIEEIPEGPSSNFVSNSKPILQEKDNPVLVLTKDDDDDDEPIGLSMRQPSFSSLHGNIIPKGGLITPDLPEIADDPEEPEQATSQNTTDAEEPLGLHVRQSSYSNLKMINQISSPSKPTAPPTLVEVPEVSETPHANSISAKTVLQEEDNPVIVLTKSDDDDEDDAPIGLSMRQPSFSSLHGNIIPKGGLVSPELPEIADEPEEPLESQQNYTQNSAQNSAQNDQNRVSKEEEVPLGLHVRQSSYANLKMTNQLAGSPAKPLASVPMLPEIDETGQEICSSHSNSAKSDANRLAHSQMDHSSATGSIVFKEEDNPVLVLTANDEDDDAPIGLSMRQPSFSSLHGNIVPKGCLVAPDLEDIVDEDEQQFPDPTKNSIKNDQNENDNDRLQLADKQPSSQILKSLVEINTKRWKEIGYNPQLPRNQTLCAFNANSNANQSKAQRKLPQSCAQFFPPTAAARPGLKRVLSNDHLTTKNANNSISNTAISNNSISNNSISHNSISNNPISNNSISNNSISHNSIHGCDYNNGLNNGSNGEKKKAIVRVGSFGSRMKAMEVELPDQAALQNPNPNGKSRVPERLHTIMPKNRDTPLWHCLEGEKVAPGSIPLMLAALSSLQQDCNVREWEEESNFLEVVISQLVQQNDDYISESFGNDQNYSGGLCQCGRDPNENEENWPKTEEELKQALDEIDEHQNADLERLQLEWSSESTRNKFNTPSATLVDMRQHVKKLVAAKKFEDAAKMASLIEKREQEETEEAARRMRTSYQRAIEALQRQHDEEREYIRQIYLQNSQNSQNQENSQNQNSQNQENSQNLPCCQNSPNYATSGDQNSHSRNSNNGSMGGNSGRSSIGERKRERTGRSACAAGKNPIQTRQPILLKPVVNPLANQKLSLPPLSTLKASPLRGVRPVSQKQKFGV